MHMQPLAKNDITPEHAAELLDMIDNCPEGHYVFLSEEDPAYEEIGDVKIYSTRILRDSPEDLEALARGEVTGLYCFVDFYTNDGHRLPIGERPDGWWESFPEDVRDAAENITQHPNGIARLGTDHFTIGRGSGFYAVAETTLDGEPAIEFHHWQKVNADRRRAKRASYVDDNPEIGEHQPLWASQIDVEPHPERDGVLEVTYWIGCGVPDLYFTQDAELVEGGPFRFVGKPTLETHDGSFEVGSEGFIEVVGELRAFVDAVASHG